MTFPYGAALLVALVGCVTDVRSRRIPNLLTFSAAAGAFGYYLAGQGLAAFGWSVLGWAVGLVMFLPFFLLRGLGGGDVKLMAAIGAWLLPTAAAWTALWAMVAGGPMALLLAWTRNYTGRAFTNVWGLLTYWRVAGLRPHPSITLEASGAPRLPYALPIAAGLLVTLWLR